VRTWLTDSICDVKDGSCLGIDNLIGPAILQSRGHKQGSRKEGSKLGTIAVFHTLKSNRWAVGMKVKYSIPVLDVVYFLTGYESDRQAVKQNSRIILVSIRYHADSQLRLRTCTFQRAPGSAGSRNHTQLSLRQGDNTHWAVRLPAEDKGSDPHHLPGSGASMCPSRARQLG